VQTVLTGAITTSTVVAGNLPQVVPIMLIREKGHTAVVMMHSTGIITITSKEVTTSKLPAIKATCSHVVNHNIVAAGSLNSIAHRLMVAATEADIAAAVDVATAAAVEGTAMVAVVAEATAAAAVVDTAVAVEGTNLKTIPYSNI
jgi:hypothetical protein